MLSILEDISKGKGKMEDLDKIYEIGTAMSKASLCALGQTAPNPVLSTIKYFKDEYIEHIEQNKCRAGKCKDLVSYTIDPAKCTGCTMCARKCPVPCIAGEKRQPHVIDQSKCIKCGICYTVCKFGAVMKG